MSDEQNPRTSLKEHTSGRFDAIIEQEKELVPLIMEKDGLTEDEAFIRATVGLHLG